MATKQLSPTTKSILGLLAIVPVVFICFCAGYFVIGKGVIGFGTDSTAAPVTGPTPTVVLQTPPVPHFGPVVVIDNTAAVDAMRKKAEERAKKKASDAAKRKAAEDAKRKADEAANLLNATPAPESSPASDPNDTPATTTTIPDPGESPAPDNTPTSDAPVPPANAPKPPTNSDIHHQLTVG